MDKTLELKLEDFKKALKTLEDVLTEEYSQIIRDAVIKRFEYCFELCWKTSKVFLSDHLGTDVFAPKQCFRELRKNQLMSDEDTELLIKMNDERNEVIHTYREEFAEELHERIKKYYYDLMKRVYNAISD